MGIKGEEKKNKPLNDGKADEEKVEKPHEKDKKKT